jgi:hypothetical protein
MIFKPTQLPVWRVIPFCTTLALLALLASCNQTLDPVIDISGRWTGTATNFVDFGDGTASITIVFSQDKELLQGTLTDGLGGEYNFTGSILRDDVFLIWRNEEDGVDFRFTGLLTGRTIAGTWRMGDLRTFEILNNGQWSVIR